MFKKISALFILLTVCACTSTTSSTSEENSSSTYDSFFDRFVKNVFVKEKGDKSITYEYRDVRVDEVAALAARYCEETYQTPAHLQAIRLHKNNARLATFHCYKQTELQE